jgi:hypothetical protein
MAAKNPNVQLLIKWSLFRNLRHKNRGPTTAGVVSEVPSLNSIKGPTMKSVILAAILLAVAWSVQAKDKPAYEKGVLLQMDSSSCGYAEKGAKTLAGEILGTDAQHKKTQEVLCQEYILKTNRLIYRIRPKDDKHPALLPVGESAEFRLHKDKMLLRVPEADGKEREYIVVSMTPSADAADTKASAKATL